MISCKTTPIIISEPLIYNFSDLETGDKLAGLSSEERDIVVEIIKLYTRQVKELKIAYDDLVIQIESADGTKITVVYTDPPVDRDQ